MRRRRRVALAVALAVIAAAAVAVAAATGGGAKRSPRARAGLRVGRHDAGRRSARKPARTPTHTAAPKAPRAVHARPPFPVGHLTLRLVEPGRVIDLTGGATIPRALVTYVRYPARGAGPFPLVVFGHGFDETPGLYAPLLDAWARAGYVVAAPVFPLASPSAPGGPTEADLPNQPADMRFVITSVLAASRKPSGVLRGLVAPGEIAVAGQSDGGDTALAVAYDPRFADPRVRAAVILSGAEMPNLSAFTIALGGPPLLATQGTADTINAPSATAAFYDPAPAPKYLLQLLGAGHLPPYSTDLPEVRIVARVTLDFLGAYLGHAPGALARMRRAGDVAGVATLAADP